MEVVGVRMADSDAAGGLDRGADVGLGQGGLGVAEVAAGCQECGMGVLGVVGVAGKSNFICSIVFGKNIN